MAEQSPSWDDRVNMELVDGAVFDGVPFTEGFPLDQTVRCELILVYGGRAIAHHDTKMWITEFGRIVPEAVVAAWKVLDTQPQGS